MAHSSRLDVPTDRSPLEWEPSRTRSRPIRSRDSIVPRATRYEPHRNEACLAWRETYPGLELEAIDPAYSTCPAALLHFALLLDISQSGASIALDRVPRPEDGVRLRLEGESLDWTEAEVVGVTRSPLGPHLVRLAFRAPCPFETLVAVICG